MTAFVIAAAILMDSRLAAAETRTTAPTADTVRVVTDVLTPVTANQSFNTTTETGRGSTGSGGRVPRVRQVQALANGQFCSVGAPWHFGRSLGIGVLPACPVAPGTPAPPPPTPLEAAYQAWSTQVVLPDPTLSTNPTRAITGLDTFLTIGGAQTVTWAGAALGHQVRIDVVSTYDIDWGDPRPDETKANGRARINATTSQGGPWPNGDLRHQYIERGSATIQVTQRWTAHWSVGSESGTLADRLLTTSSLVLPVEEIQAIVTG